MNAPIPTIANHQTHGSSAVGFSSPDPAPDIAIGGWGAITAFGDIHSTWDALLAGRYISDHARCRTSQPPRGIDRATHLAHVASAHLIERTEPDAALIIGTSKGPVESWLSSASTGPGLGAIAASFERMRGPRLTLSAACASGLHALIRGAIMIQSREARQVLVIATESSLHPLFVASFQRLGVLPKPGIGCRPFDDNRDGFLMSEAAAAVLLQASEPGGDASAGAAFPRILLDRFALGADATHLTGLDPAGKVLKSILARVIGGNEPDLIHAHGTGTAANDPIELAAIESALPPMPDSPILYSHKGSLGHSLGASGLLSVVLNCQMHTSGVVPPNIRTTCPLPTQRVVLSNRPTGRPICRSIALAAGFGGPIAAITLKSRPWTKQPGGLCPTPSSA